MPAEGTLNAILLDTRRGLMTRHTPRSWPAFVPGVPVPDATPEDLASIAKRFDAHFRAWSGGVGLADYLAAEVEGPKAPEP